MRYKLLLYGLVLIGLSCSQLQGDDGYQLWLKYPVLEHQGELLQQLSSISIQGESEISGIVRAELKQGLSALLGREILSQDEEEEASLIAAAPDHCPEILKYVRADELSVLGKEGFWIRSIDDASKPSLVLAANSDIGLLYGAFHLLRLIQSDPDIKSIDVMSLPKIQYRLLNHWDNLDGSVERGYAGKSLWKWDELPETVDPRYADYARANASIGVNGTVLNNVNANPQILKPEYLRKIAALADVFCPYGIRVFLSINFSSPISAQFGLEANRRGGIGNLPTSDPLDPKVRQWWKDKASEIYEMIPDFGGFLVKANSEGMPGPLDYGRTHVDGANMLAEALAPHGGIVMWRAFVYNADIDPDRAKRAYMDFAPLDGQFHPNVFVQGKNGPIDFQPREPVQPLFGAMPKTPLMLELQITQEYLGHSTHLVYLAPMWKEYLDFDTHAEGQGSTLASVIDGSLHEYSMTGITGVTNIGDDRNWTGHLFAQANWYAYGRLAWDHTLSPDQIAQEWIRQTLTQDDETVRTIQQMMAGTWEACINYMTPLGLHHIMQAGFHYGPQPGYSDAPRLDWTSVYYHRADSIGLGFDRTSSGSDAVSQYASPLREQFNDLRSCPEKYLLWFHHVPWNYPMRSGRTLWDELCSRYYRGTDYVHDMIKIWNGLQGEIDPEIHNHVSEKLEQHETDARIWRDSCLKYFREFSRMEIVKE